MKKVIQFSAIAAISVFAFLTLTTSCKKKSSSTSCTCHYPSPFTSKDTSFTYPVVAGGSTCAQENTAIQSIYPTGGCN